MCFYTHVLQLGLADEDYQACRAEGLSVTSDADTMTLRRLFHRPSFRVTVREEDNDVGFSFMFYGDTDIDQS